MGKPAARIDDDVAHRKGSGPILEGCRSVRIGGAQRYAARIGDKVKHSKAEEVVIQGEPTVRIGGEGRFAARMGDKVGCKGIIVGGCGTVRIGRDPAEDCLIEAHTAGDSVVTDLDTSND